MVKRVCVTEWEEPGGDICLKAKGVFYPFFKHTIAGYKSVPEMFERVLEAAAKGTLAGTLPKSSLKEGTRFNGNKYYVTLGDNHA